MPTTANGGTASIEVVVKLARQAVARESAEHQALLECAAELGVPLEPIDPSASDPELSAYLVARVERRSLDSVVERLARCAGVEAAYAKPEGQPPEGGAQHAR